MISYEFTDYEGDKIEIDLWDSGEVTIFVQDAGVELPVEEVDKLREMFGANEELGELAANWNADLDVQETVLMLMRQRDRLQARVAELEKRLDKTANLTGKK